MSKDKFVWLIGGGQLQEPMCQEIKARGYRLLLTDADDSCICIKYADDFWNLSTYDVVGHVKLALRFKEAKRAPIAVLTDAADVGITVSEVASILNLPACRLDTAYVINRKDALREHLTFQDHPVYVVTSNDEWCTEGWLKWYKRCADHGVHTFPCIIKPIGNCASRGITKCCTLDDFEHGWQHAVAHNRGSGAQLVIEECLQGREYATDWFVRDGVPYYVNGAERVFSDFGIELGHINPLDITTVPYTAIQKSVEKLCIVTGIHSGPLKIDWLEDATHGPVILEAATRWSGGYDHGYTAKYATGRNLEKPLLDYALGLSVDEHDFEWKTEGYAACMGWHEDDERIVGRYINSDIAKRYPSVRKIIAHAPKIVDRPNNADRNIFVICEGVSATEAWNNCVKVWEGV